MSRAVKLQRIADRYPTESADRLALLEAAQVMKRLDDTGVETFRCWTLVSRATGDGKIDVVWHGALNQIDTKTAREIAWMLLQAATDAEAEAILMRFLTVKLQISQQIAAAVLGDFRQYRDAHDTPAPELEKTDQPIDDKPADQEDTQP